MSESLQDIKIETAVKEIVAAAQSILTKEIIEKWVSDYSQLWQQMINDLAPIPAPWEEIHGRPMFEFDGIYIHFAVLMKYFETETICEIAMNEYQSILVANSKKHDKLRLQQWVRKYELIYSKNLLPTPIEEGDVNNVKTICDVSYAVSADNFTKSMEFYDIFTDLFWVQQILPDRIAEIRKERREQWNKLRGGL